MTPRFVAAPDGTRLAVRVAGSGPPLVLLHGFPQNHRCWLPLLPALSERFTCILPDLRGYGDSDAPADDPQHETYSKRRMALDLVAILDDLGHARAHVAGHDRGARVAYRFALDHPDRLDRLAILEVVPTLDFWEAWDADLGFAAYHWTFLAQPAPMPERLLSADPSGWIDHTLASWTRAKSLDCFEAEALDSYRAQACDPARLTAMCADYRAGFHADRRIDAESRAAGQQIRAPMRFIWAETGFPARTGDPAGIWRDWCARPLEDVAVPSGHFAPEEVPDAVSSALLGHFEHQGPA
ncbi:alpha/beta fold hydrolase [Jannaschia aquimarina]|uniref:Fluoroacetate dehalogenase n=1 Tax=Jannaschia aquimarina TaxID=935700 RepID=A0A0D1ECN7_9RHOB|nr:alpha/beta hydrolase [Jannaschia aquimarina]KIT15489.1 Fluoroacetate dehalogenase [Jannaschia aquimarina]SNT34068.1 haloacetate dehalogenase [Jannaschia aquimarina]